MRTLGSDVIRAGCGLRQADAVGIVVPAQSRWRVFVVVDRALHDVQALRVAVGSSLGLLVHPVHPVGVALAGREEDPQAPHQVRAIVL